MKKKGKKNECCGLTCGLTETQRELIRQKVDGLPDARKAELRKILAQHETFVNELRMNLGMQEEC
jgi:hypothetical protein